MKIYIASSWSNIHAVELLTEKFRKLNHEVFSFTENDLYSCEEIPPNLQFIGNIILKSK
jgi:hypothetical protein